MKISAFTFLRNAHRLQFPFVESIRSALPLVDEFVVALGPCDDDTEAMLRAIGDPKIRILPTAWNENLDSSWRVKGFIYGQQKTIALFNCTGDWAIYLEGDEVLHEDDLPRLRAAMERHLGNPRVEALYFRYLHFYGNRNTVADSPRWYRREVRAVRNDLPVWGPKGLFFSVLTGYKRMRYPRAAFADATIYHYGWVRHPLYMQRKIDAVSQFYTGISPEEAERKALEQEFDYGGHYDAVARFQGTHPRVMEERIKRLNWKANLDANRKRMSLRYRLLYYFEKLTGIRPFEFRNYKTK